MQCEEIDRKSHTYGGRLLGFNYLGQIEPGSGSQGVERKWGWEAADGRERRAVASLGYSLWCVQVGYPQTRRERPPLRCVQQGDEVACLNGEEGARPPAASPVHGVASTALHMCRHGEDRAEWIGREGWQLKRVGGPQGTGRRNPHVRKESGLVERVQEWVRNVCGEKKIKILAETLSK
jgi:hypothetical protein